MGWEEIHESFRPCVFCEKLLGSQCMVRAPLRRRGFNAFLVRGGPGRHDVILVFDWFLMMSPSRPALGPTLNKTTRIHFSLSLPTVTVEGAPDLRKFSPYLMFSILIATEIRETDPSSPLRLIGCFPTWPTFPCIGAVILNS